MIRLVFFKQHLIKILNGNKWGFQQLWAKGQVLLKALWMWMVFVINRFFSFFKGRWSDILNLSRSESQITKPATSGIQKLGPKNLKLWGMCALVGTVVAGVWLFGSSVDHRHDKMISNPPSKLMESDQRALFGSGISKPGFERIQQQVAPVVQGLSGTTNEHRVALVVGNSEYRQVPELLNPINDAEDMRAILEDLGFEVTALFNVDRKTLEKNIHRYSEKITPNTVSLFFYAGHGIQVDGKNYLIPVDAKLKSLKDLRFEVVSLDAIIRELSSKSPRMNVMILDACRDNPVLERLVTEADGQSFAVYRGLAAVEGLDKTGTLIAYATTENQVAADGEGRNSPYTAALLEWIQQPNLEIGLMFRKVRETVQAATRGQQTPWETGTVTGNFYFNRSLEIGPGGEKIRKRDEQPQQDTSGQIQQNQSQPGAVSNAPPSNSPATNSPATSPQGGSPVAPGNQVSQPTPAQNTSSQTASPQTTSPQTTSLGSATVSASMPPPVSGGGGAEEDGMWMAIQKLRNTEQLKSALNEYLRVFPNGKFSSIARIQLSDLQEQQAKHAAAVATGQSPDPTLGQVPGQDPAATDNAAGTEGGGGTPPAFVGSAPPANEQELSSFAKVLPEETRIQVQEALATLGYFHEEVTGHFGPPTFGAIYAYQADRGDVPTGYFTPQQLVILFADAARNLRENPDATQLIKTKNSPNWYVAATPSGEIGYVYGVAGNPYQTVTTESENLVKDLKPGDVEQVKGVQRRGPRPIHESKYYGGYSLGSVYGGVDPVATMWSSAPPPSPLTKGKTQYQVILNAVVKAAPAIYAKEVGKLLPGDWVIISGRLPDYTWYQISAPDGQIGYVEGFALAKPVDIR